MIEIITTGIIIWASLHLLLFSSIMITLNDGSVFAYREPLTFNYITLPRLFIGSSERYIEILKKEVEKKL